MFSDEISVLPILKDPRPNLIWTRLYPIVDRIVRHALGAAPAGRLDPDAEDLVCESTYAALRNIERYRSTFRGLIEPSARAWLRQVCRNAARRHAVRRHRKSKRYVATDPVILEMVIDRTFHHAPVEYDGIDRDCLERMIPNPGWRSIWLLHNRPGKALSHEEIAEITGHTVGSVKVFLSRARSDLRERHDSRR